MDSVARVIITVVAYGIIGYSTSFMFLQGFCGGDFRRHKDIAIVSGVAWPFVIVLIIISSINDGLQLRDRLTKRKDRSDRRQSQSGCREVLLGGTPAGEKPGEGHKKTVP